MPVFRNVMAFLGLDEDDQIYDDEAYYEEERTVERSRRSQGATIPLEDRLGGTAVAGGFGFRADSEKETGGVGAVRPLRRREEDSTAGVPESLGGTAERRRPVPGGFAPFTAQPEDDQQASAQAVGDARFDVGFDDDHDRSDGDTVVRDAGASATDRSPTMSVVDPGPATGGQRPSNGAVATRESKPSAITYAKPRLHMPDSFDDASRVADDFRAGFPVVVNMAKVDKPVARRLVDFASGVCYVLSGGMERLAANVYLLTPSGIDVSSDDRRRMQERGYER